MAVAFILIIFGFGVMALQQAYFDAGLEGGAQKTLTETVTVDKGNVTHLSQSNQTHLVYADQGDITVTISNDDVIALGNWSWNQHNGTIRWLEDSDLTDGGNADVTYTFANPNREQDFTRDITAIPTATLVDEWLVIGILILVLSAAAVVGRSGR